MKIASRPGIGNWLDGFATCASAACLVHCLVLPIVIALLPAIVGSIDPGERFHQLILLVAMPTSGLALVPGWRQNGDVLPLVVGVAGLLFLCAGVTLSESPAFETALTVAGSLLLAGAHITNWRMRKNRSSVDVGLKGDICCPRHQGDQSPIR